MKKVVLILLINVYSLATMGFSVNQFYCCGKLKPVSEINLRNLKNSCSKGNKKSGCCDNNYQFVKIQDNYSVAEDIKAPVKQFINLDINTTFFQAISFYSCKIIICNKSNAPPLHSGVPTYLYNCLFRI